MTECRGRRRRLAPRDDDAEEKANARRNRDGLPRVILDEFLGVVTGGSGGVAQIVGLLVKLVADLADGFLGLGFQVGGAGGEVVADAHDVNIEGSDDFRKSRDYFNFERAVLTASKLGKSFGVAVCSA